MGNGNDNPPEPRDFLVVLEDCLPCRFMPLHTCILHRDWALSEGRFAVYWKMTCIEKDQAHHAFLLAPSLTSEM